MPTKVVIASGLSAGTEFWIEETVSRLGSDPRGQLCVTEPDVPPHVATLEYRGGEYLLHNRRATPLILNGQEIPPRGSSRWSAGQMLQLTEAVTLRLESTGDPAPCPRPAAALAEQTEETAEEESRGEPNPADGQPTAASGERSKKLLPLVVTVFCLVAGGFLLLADTSSSEDAPVRNVPRDFDKLIVALAEEKSPADLDIGEVRSALQAARIAELRGDPRRAQGYYGYLRDLLLARRKPDGTFATELEVKMWEFVGGQLRSPPSAEGEQKT